MSTLEYAASVADKKRRIFATFPAAHKRAPVDGEVFPDKEAAILRLKDWSCYQGFAAVLGHGEHKKRGIQRLANGHSPTSVTTSAERIQLYTQLVSAFSKQIRPEENRERFFSRHLEDGFGPLLPDNNSDSEVEYMGIQPVQNPQQSSSKDPSNTASPASSEQSDDFVHIDGFDDKPSSSKLPPPLMKWPHRLSQQRALVISDDSTSSAVTRVRRGVAAKSFKKARLESQEGHE